MSFSSVLTRPRAKAETSQHFIVWQCHSCGEELTAPAYCHLDVRMRCWTCQAEYTIRPSRQHASNRVHAA